MQIITVKEVAEKLKCSQCFVYKHYKTLGGFKIKGIIRFTQENLDNLIGGGNERISVSGKVDV